MAHAIYTIPLWLLALLLVIVCVGTSVGGVLLLRRLGWQVHPDDNSGAGLLHAFVGVVYAVALGLIVVQVQSEYGDVDEAVAAEASAVGDLYRNLDGWSDPDRTRLQNELREYVRLVLAEEWPAVRAGGRSDRTWKQMDRVAHGVIALRPADDRENTLYGALLDDVDSVLDARRARLFHGVTGIGTTMWLVIVLGALVTLGMACMFHFTHRRTQLLATALMSTMFGMMMFLIIAMDHPLWGQLSVDPDSFLELRENFMRLDASERATPHLAPPSGELPTHVVP
jgi:hypothetical protein